LAVLNRWFPTHYLWTSAIALELAILHNFLWHLKYTWRDRRDCSPRRAQLVRFHLSNGMASMVGNLVLMRVLVNQAQMPVVAANAIAILCCSVLNFCLADVWTFAARPVED